MMNDPKVIDVLEDTGAFLNGHFPLSSGRHSAHYVNKDAVTVYPQELERLGKLLARQFRMQAIDVVCAAAVGSIALGYQVALSLSQIYGREVKFVFAEHEEYKFYRATKLAGIQVDWVTEMPKARDREAGTVILHRGDELLAKRQAMTLKRGYAKIVPDAYVLLVEDILTTGGSAAEMKSAVSRIQRASGHPARGTVVGLGCLVNRGGVTAEQLGVPKLVALVELDLESWEPADCPLCAEGQPMTPVK